MPSTIYVKNVIAVTVRLNALDCPECGVIFGISEDFEAKRRSDGRSFHCPNSHSMSYGESDADRLRRLWGAATQERDDTRAHNDRLLASLSAKNKELAGIKARAKAGVCTECHRHFVNVERHYKSKHSPGQA
jgi:predicted RNA-binding Zn-ribbon protein involved in translation (DUF1610 family)